MGCSIRPRDQLKIFVSSAQRNEGDLEWEKVRERVVKNLRECPFLNPFIIEDSGSELPSTQKYLFEVEQSDLVVLLVKGIIREGTAREISSAMTRKKPMLVYFLEDENPSYTVEKLKQNLRENDYCTYKKINSIEKVEEQILQEVIENVLGYYKFNHYTEARQPEGQAKFAELSAAEQFISTPTKETFALFESAYNHVFDCLSLGYLKIRDKDVKQATLHSFGTKAIDWLVRGAEWLEGKDVLALAESVESIFGKNDWYLRRWDAIKSALAGDYEKALTDEADALEKAKKANTPTWIVLNILIDCRNLSNTIDNINRQYSVDSFAQKELDESKSMAFLPVADRFLENMYKEMLDAEMDLDLSSPFTEHYGSNLAYVIRDCINNYFAAILYGSYTHIILSRETLADLLYKYSKIVDAPELLLRAIDLYILSGNTKKLKQILENKWEDCYAGVTSHADRIWSVTDSTIDSQKTRIKCAVFGKLGMYFSDALFDKALSFVKGLLPALYWGNSEDYLKCILENVMRIDAADIIDILLDILSNKKFSMGRTISEILLRINIREVPEEKLRSFHDVLLDSMHGIFELNGNPQYIAALEKQRPEIFHDLANKPDNGLVGGEKLYYELNLGGTNYDPLYEELISMARDQFVENSSGKGFSFFAVQPYASISSLIMNGNQMSKEAEEHFFDLCKDVFNSNAPIPVKDDCCDCLCDVLISRHTRKEPVPELLIGLVPMLDNQKDSGFYYHRSNTENTYLCRTLLLKILLGKANEDEIVRWSIMLGKVDINERIIIAKCAKKYLQFLSIDEIEPNSVILAVTLQCIEDDYHSVRQYGCDCLCYLLKTRYHDLAESKLFEMALDSSHWVRNRLISLCKKRKINDSTVSFRLLEILKRDANYGIRTFAATVSAAD